VIVVAYSAWNEIRSLLGPTQLFHFWLISDENEFQLKRQYVWSFHLQINISVFMFIR